MKINPYIFREYDIRGKVVEDFPPEVVVLLGRSFGTLVKRSGGREIAISLSEAGVNIAIHYNKSETKAIETLNEIKKFNVNSISWFIILAKTKTNPYTIEGILDLDSFITTYFMMS